MLQRTRAEQVIPVYKSFVKNYPNINDAVSADEEEIREMLGSLGLKWRIENILLLIKELEEREDVPEKYEELVELPGVGDYIASAFLSLHLDRYQPIIDSNAVRLWGRIFGLTTDKGTRRKKDFRELVDKITPSQDYRIFNLGVLDFTRKICKSRPLHSNCPARKICEYYKATQYESTQKTI